MEGSGMSEFFEEAELSVGPRAIEAYSRLSYTMWYALAEFIDNSTQSRLNYDSIIDKVLAEEGTPLVVTIEHNKLSKTITIEDNSIGMTKADLLEALKIAHPTKDSKGRSKYGLGMKTAACWIAKRWKVVTTEWGSGEEWTADVNVPDIVNNNGKIRLTTQKLETKDKHYTRIVLSDLNRQIHKRTEETIRSYLGSMYRHDINQGRLTLVFNNDPIAAPDDLPMDSDHEGKAYRRTIDAVINGKKVTGWFGVLRHGAGSRKHGGFSLFQSGRMIQGFPSAWKPRSIFGGEVDEGANNLVAQRLTGVVDLDSGFAVSHTKDAILFQDDEEEKLEAYLIEHTKEYREYAGKRRSAKGSPWSKEKMKDLLDSMKGEFTSDELKDTISSTLLPPLELILSNNKKVVQSVKDEDKLLVLDILPDLKVTVAVQERSENDPHLTIDVGADPGSLLVVINRLHPYYRSLESNEAISECMKQYIYDGIAEYRVMKQASPVNPNSVRRLKHEFLQAGVVRIENEAAAAHQKEVELINGAIAAEPVEQKKAG
jgi:hypothetical protein